MVRFSSTNIKSSPLRLIGLYLRNMDRNVSKNLSNGWYPFGDFEQPNDGYVEVPNLTDTEHSIYLINSKIPQITINCIVGKNGAGKSSLLDVMYRVINNLACRLSQCELNIFSEDLQYAVTTQSFDIGTRFQGRAVKFSPPLKTFGQKSYFVVPCQK